MPTKFDQNIEPKFFATPDDLRAWFEANHDTASDIWVALYKKGNPTQNVTYAEAVTVGLCFGWIDSAMRRIDDEVRVQRFTPRKKKSYWSAVNIAKVEELIAAGKMHEAGLRVFNERDQSVAPKYSFEQSTEPEFDAGQLAQFQANQPAWEYFQACTPSYKKRTTHWVTSAKRAETRQSRLETLIAACAEKKSLDWEPKPKTAERS